MIWENSLLERRNHRFKNSPITQVWVKHSSDPQDSNGKKMVKIWPTTSSAFGNDVHTLRVVRRWGRVLDGCIISSIDQYIKCLVSGSLVSSGEMIMKGWLQRKAETDDPDLDYGKHGAGVAASCRARP